MELSKYITSESIELKRSVIHLGIVPNLCIVVTHRTTFYLFLINNNANLRFCVNYIY